MKILSFDVESNGLHGDAFSVAGLLMDDQRQIHSEFLSRCPITGPVDPWVKDNVLTAMHDIPETAPDAKSMRSAFWAWYLKMKPQADIIVAANPYPVEARFLIACQEDNLPEREFEHPFPYCDLASMLLTLGLTTKEQRHDFVVQAVGDQTGQSHNPVWDATATALGAIAALERGAQTR